MLVVLVVSLVSLVFVCLQAALLVSFYGFVLFGILVASIVVYPGSFKVLACTMFSNRFYFCEFPEVSVINAHNPGKFVFLLKYNILPLGPCIPGVPGPPGFPDVPGVPGFPGGPGGPIKPSLPSRPSRPVDFEKKKQIIVIYGIKHNEQ